MAQIQDFMAHPVRPCFCEAATVGLAAREAGNNAFEIQA
jgi:hypothetical protein